MVAYRSRSRRKYTQSRRRKKCRSKSRKKSRGKGRTLKRYREGEDTLITIIKQKFPKENEPNDKNASILLLWALNLIRSKITLNNGSDYKAIMILITSLISQNKITNKEIIRLNADISDIIASSLQNVEKSSPQVEIPLQKKGKPLPQVGTTYSREI